MQQASLFDTLFIYQDFPEFKLEGGGVRVRDAESSVTSTYPLTLVVYASETISITAKYHAVLKSSAIEVILENFNKIISRLVQEPEVTLLRVRGSIEISDKAISEKIKPSPVKSLIHRDPMPAGKSDGIHTSKPGARASISTEYVEPKNDVELTLCHMWEELFGLSSIGIRDNFFDLGGTSLMAIMLFDRIKKRYQRDIPLTALVAHPSIEKLAKVIIQGDFEDSKKCIVPLTAGNSTRIVWGLHSLSGQILFYKYFMRAVSNDFTIYGIQADGQAIQIFREKGIKGLATYYIEQMRKIQPNGPYALLSYCNTNGIAMEMAQQMLHLGEKVAPLIIIDARPVGINIEPLNTWENILVYSHWMLKGKFKYVLYRIVRKFRVINQGTTRKNKEIPEENDSNTWKIKDILKKLLNLSNSKHHMQPYPVTYLYTKQRPASQRDFSKRNIKTWKKSRKWEHEGIHDGGQSFLLFL